MSAAWSRAASDYFRTHGISDEVAVQAGVTELEGTLFYPYVAPDGTCFDRRRPLRAKSTFQPTGVPLCVWWPKPGRPVEADIILLTEGESDALAARSALDASPMAEFAQAAIAAIPGTGFPASRVAVDLKDLAPSEVFVVFDPDPAGESARGRVVSALNAVGINAVPVFLPPIGDLADCLVAKSQNPDYLSHLLLDARCANEDEPAPPVTEDDTAADLARKAGNMKRAAWSQRAIEAALRAENQEVEPQLGRARLEGLMRSTAGWRSAPPWLADPLDFIYDRRLNYAARLVLLVIALRADAGGHRRIGYRRLGALAGMGKNRVGPVVKSLVKAGRIEVIQASARGTEYRVLGWSASHNGRVPTEGTELREGLSQGSSSPHSGRSSVPASGTARRGPVQ